MDDLKWGRWGKPTPKQLRFVEEYTRDFNATQAAIRAGYSPDSAKQTGWENVHKPHIAAAIKERMDELSMSADEALVHITEIARGSVGDLIDVLPDGSWKLDVSKAEKAGKLGLVAELAYDSNGLPKVKLYDRLAALRDIAKIRGLYVDKVEHSGPDGGPLEVAVTRRIIRPGDDG